MIQPTCNASQPYSLYQLNAPAESMYQRSIADYRAQNASYPVPTQQCLHNTYPGLPCHLCAQHSVPLTGLHASNPSAITGAPAIIDTPAIASFLMDPYGMSPRCPTPPWPVSHSSRIDDVYCDPTQFTPISGPDVSFLPYQQPYNDSAGIPLTSPPAGNPDQWFPSSTQNHQGNVSGYQGPGLGTNTHKLVDPPSHYSAMNGLQPSASSAPNGNETILTSRSLATPLRYLQPTSTTATDFRYDEARYVRDSRLPQRQGIFPGVQSEVQPAVVPMAQASHTHLSTATHHQLHLAALPPQPANEPQNVDLGGTSHNLFFCRTCQAGPFGRSHERDRHENSVHGPPGWKCEVCEKLFTRKDIMKKHRKDAHTR